uniref:Peroxisome multifunctional protein n=1 Tax=Gambierdiscus polynesiensis TaxID=439318 RepID=A0A6M5KEK9_9DINO|nr:peroxisome multifunctional protein [Gambierdiscus polynesiensis]
MTLRFDGQVALVTGAGRGLGREYALLLAKRGAKVVVNNRTPEKADEVVAEIRAFGGTALADYSNVAREGEKAVERCVSEFGRVDVVVSNAGQLADRTLKKMTVEDFQDVLDTHATGGFRVMKAAWPHMTEQKYGRLVFIGSVAAFYGGFGQGNYAAAKGALMGLSGICAVEGFKSNILSNLICTEGITRMNENLVPKQHHAAMKAEYAANAVLCLCHESCPSTGAMYQTEGGAVRQLRMQVSSGLRYDPTKDGLDHVAANWEKTGDFAKHSFPAEQRHPKVQRSSRL